MLQANKKLSEFNIRDVVLFFRHLYRFTSDELILRQTNYKVSFRNVRNDVWYYILDSYQDKDDITFEDIQKLFPELDIKLVNYIYQYLGAMILMEVLNLMKSN